MTAFLYDIGKRLILETGGQLTADRWHVALLRAGSNPNPFVHESLADLPADAVLGTYPLTGLRTEVHPARAAVRVTADDLVADNVPAGEVIGYIVTYVDPDGLLISCSDNGLPVVSNGGRIAIRWNQEDGIFSVAMEDVVRVPPRSPERSLPVRPNSTVDPGDPVALPFPIRPVALGRFDGLDDEEDI